MFVRIALLAPLLMMAVPVCAGPAQIKVSYADLNLASTAGQATLERRLNGAVRQVCEISGDPSLTAYAAMRKCRTDARAAIPPKVELALARAAAASELVADSTVSGDRTSALR